MENKWERVSLTGGEAERLYSKARSFAGDVWFRFRRKPTALAGLILALVMILFAVIGPFFTPNNQATTTREDVDKLWWHSPLKYADNCTTPTLFIHSDSDYRCWMVEGLSMFTALKMHGCPARLCLFKGETHELSRSGRPGKASRTARRVMRRRTSSSTRSGSVPKRSAKVTALPSLSVPRGSFRLISACCLRLWRRLMRISFSMQRAA